MNKVVLRDCKDQAVLIYNSESIEALMSCNNGGDVFIYLEDYEEPIKAFKMNQIVKDIENSLNKKLLKSKGANYNCGPACEYDYFIPDKIRYITPCDQDGYASKIIVSSGRCWRTKDTVEELNKQLDSIYNEKLLNNDIEKYNAELKSIAEFQQLSNMDRYFQLKRSEEKLAKYMEDNDE